MSRTSDMSRPNPATVHLRRTGAGAEPAVMIATWLIDELHGSAAVEVGLSDPDLIRLSIDPPQACAAAVAIVGEVLDEQRFRGWELDAERSSTT
jgi:hypothetical protein